MQKQTGGMVLGREIVKAQTVDDEIVDPEEEHPREDRGVRDTTATSSHALFASQRREQAWGDGDVYTY